ncbi:MAG: hypothetical protein LCI00_14700 [Chloroflexi bacterium]|nr:hypothetical protein [Chloroflexota bacterium]MCC6895273.1 hypothetical protein [Anaerolineae bacterium]
MKKMILVLMTAMLVALMLSMGTGAALAQTATATPSGSTQFNSSVTIFGVICENQAVVNLNGTMEPAYDVYYQVFSGAQGGGTALTNLRRVQVDGTYAFSEAVPYSGGTVATGATGSVKVYIAPESAPNSPAGDIFVVDDIQDGCNNAQNPVSSSIDTGAGASSGTTTTTTTSGLIRSPFGGFINSDVPVVAEGAVVIGARQFVNPQRSSTPGVIFAECDAYLPEAAPGLLYDNDNITIFFSWYAKTEAQVLDHLAKAQYSVLFQRAPLVDLNTSAITKIGANYWVFFTANVGNLKPGQYGVEYKLTWSEATFDGYDDYGPGTSNVEQGSTCSFTIERNPDDAQVVYNNIYSVR